MARRDLRVAGALAAFAGGAALAFACGTAARTAPPPRTALPDHAGGVLARASRDPSVVFGAQGYGGAAYGAVNYGGLAASTDSIDPQLLGDDGTNLAGTRYGGYVVAVDALAGGARPTPYADYTAQAVTRGGAIEGRVRWRHPPRLAESLPVAGVPGCRGPAPNQTLAVRDGGVSGAVVYLADIRRGRPLLHGLVDSADPGQRPQLGGTVIAQGCELVPQVQLMAPLGTTLELSRRGDGAHMVHGRSAGKSVFDVPLDRSGPVRRVRIDTPGVLELSADGGVAPAWIVVQAHPYYVMTDENGGFRLSDVPAGRYRLVAWHPPVATVGRGGAVVWTAPLTQTVTVTVGAALTRHVDVDLGR